MLSSLSTFGSLLPTQSALANSSNTGIIEPLYIYPYNSSSCHASNCFAWNQVNVTKSNYPNVPLFAVININNGPCDLLVGCPDPNYKQGIANLTKSGVIQLGYVWTKNGLRPEVDVKSDIDNWVSWYKPYGLKGIMMDEMPHVLGQTSYYQDLTNYIHSKGLTYSIGNPGTDVPQSYQGALDIMNIYEDNNSTGDLTNSTLQGNTSISGNPANWHTLYDKSTYSFVTYGKSSISQKLVQGKSVYVGLMYITDGDNSWSTIPSYLNTLASYLNNPSILSTIQAKDKPGNTLSIPILVFQNNNLVRNGTAPFAYNETSAWQFNFTAPQTYSSYHFCNWAYASTNTTNHSILVAPTQSTSYTATYTSTIC